MRERRLSIVVPSYNRAPYLHVFLTGLTWSSVSASEFEVIVVNDGGTDDLPGVVNHWRRAFDVRLVTLRAGGSPRNNARARNAGLATARYPIVVQTDPDIVFVDDILAAVRDGVDTGSLCSCDGYFPLTQEDTTAHVFHPGANVTPEVLRRLAAGRPNQVHSPDGVGGLHGAFACATQVLRDLGGYDESFEHWGWEDRELLVTAAARGLRRRALRGTAVVHLWHPVQRGSLGREELAATGRISRTAWDVQMQRAAAEYPRRERERPSPRRDDDGGLVGFDASAFDRWRTPADDEAFGLARARLAEGQLADALAVMPCTYQMAFDALLGEAEVLARTGHVDVACTALGMALKRPWEPLRTSATTEGDDAAPDDAVASSAASGAPLAIRTLYRGVDAALESLAWLEHRRGRRQACVATMHALEGVEGGPVRAAALRLRLALVAGDRRSARRHLVALDRHVRTPQQESLALECLLLDGRVDQARVRLQTAGAAVPQGDYFDRMRTAAYARLLGVGDPSDADPAWRDTSEYLFSVGVRAERAGLDVAAWQLLRTFLDEGGPAEPRLRADAGKRLAEARARITRVAGTALGARLCEAVPRGGAQAR